MIADELADRIAGHLRGIQTCHELPALNEAEWDALRVAVDEFDGTLPVGRLYEWFGGTLNKDCTNDLG